MGFLNSLAGAAQGNQDYQAWQQQQAAQKQAMQYQQMQMQAYAQQQQQAQQQRAQQAQVAQGYVGMLGQQNQQIPPRPGEASQPQQPPQQMQPQQPTGLDLSKVDPRTQAFLAKKNPMAFAGGVQKFQQTSQIPPYQSMNQQPQQQAPQQAQIPEPPKYSLDVAVKKLQEQGIKDPEVILAILEKNQSRLDAEAKQKLAMLKEQELSEYHRSMIGERAATREQRAPLVEAQTNDYKGRTADRPNRTEVMATNASTRQQSAQGGGGMTPDTIDYMARQLAGGNTGVLTGFGRGSQGAKDLQAVRSRAVEVLREQGVAPEESNARVAQFGGEKAGARTAATRGANLSIAATELGKFSDIALEASAGVPRTQFVPLNKAVLSVQQGSGSAEVAAFVAANESVINAFAQVAGRGTPTVAGMEHARAMLNTAQTPEQYKAVIKQLKIEAKAATESVTEVQSQQRERMGGKSEGPKSGTVENGYRFKGGDPGKQENWEKQ